MGSEKFKPLVLTPLCLKQSSPACQFWALGPIGTEIFTTNVLLKSREHSVKSLYRTSKTYTTPLFLISEKRFHLEKSKEVQNKNLNLINSCGIFVLSGTKCMFFKNQTKTLNLRVSIRVALNSHSYLLIHNPQCYKSRRYETTKCFNTGLNVCLLGSPPLKAQDMWTYFQTNNWWVKIAKSIYYL